MSTQTPDATAVSLIIPTHNRGHLIGETLDSALCQERPFAEIIVVDDGSTDDTAGVLASFGDRVRVITQGKGGVQRARNAGVAAARTPWVALCDSDDLLTPRYVAVLAEWLPDHADCDAVYCNFIAFTEAGDQPDKFSQAPDGFFRQAPRTGQFWHDISDLYLRTLAYQPLFPSGSLIRKCLYEAIGGYDPHFNGVGSEDWEFTLRLIGAGQVSLCATPLVRIRKHAGNESADNARQVRGCVSILEHALARHPAAAPYRDAILRGIDERRLLLFDHAFAHGEFEHAAELLGLMRQVPHSRRFQAKVFIMRLPRLLRQPLWRATQAA